MQMAGHQIFSKFPVTQHILNSVCSYTLNDFEYSNIVATYGHLGSLDAINIMLMTVDLQVNILSIHDDLLYYSLDSSLITNF